jgi:hypothetical protein
LCEIIGKLHARSPDDRFQTAAEVHELLGGWLSHLQHPAVHPRPRRVSSGRAFASRLFRRKMIWPAAIVIVAAAVTGTMLAFPPQPDTGEEPSGGTTAGLAPGESSASDPAPSQPQTAFESIQTDAQLAAEAMQIQGRIVELEHAWANGSSAGGAWEAELNELQRRAALLADQINHNSP